MQKEPNRVQQHWVAPVQVDGNWLWFTDPTTTTCLPYAPFDAPGLLDAFLLVEDAATAAAFARRYGFLGWSDCPADTHDPAVFAEYRATRSRHRSDRYDADYVPWVLAQAAALRWMQDAAGLQAGVADVLLEATQLPAPPDGSLVNRVRPYRAALDVVIDELNARLRDVHWQVKLRGRQLTVSWGGVTLLDALTALLAQRLDHCSRPGSDGRLVQCARPDCRRTFYTTDPRTLYCPPPAFSRRGLPYRWGGEPSKSPCATIARQRALRAKRRAEGRTSRNTAPKRRTGK